MKNNKKMFICLYKCLNKFKLNESAEIKYNNILSEEGQTGFRNIHNFFYKV